MSEKMPPFERQEPVMVGPGSPEKKKEHLKIILERFGEKHYEQFPEDKRRILEALEYEKKPDEIEAIRLANEVTNKIIEESGLRPFDVPEQNIHILPDKLFKEVERGKDIISLTSHDAQAIFMNGEELFHKFDRASTILHEMIHLKGFLALEVHEDLVKPYRHGLKINPTRQKTERIGFFYAFEGLDEAVVSEMEKRYLPQIIQQNKFLVNDYQWQTSEEAQELKKKIASETGIGPEEIIWVSKDGKEYRQFPYYEQRKVLDYIVEQIYEDNRERFNSSDEVMKLFFKSDFNGRLLDIARLIEKSFGKGAFRMVGIMGKDKNSAYLVMDYLTKRGKK